MLNRWNPAAPVVVAPALINDAFVCLYPFSLSFFSIDNFFFCLFFFSRGVVCRLSSFYTQLQKKWGNGKKGVKVIEDKKLVLLL